MPEQVQPVNQGETLNIHIKDTGKRGDGIGYVDGFVIFVPKTKPGDNVRVRVEKVFPKCAIASLIEHIEEEEATH